MDDDSAVAFLWACLVLMWMIMGGGIGHLIGKERGRADGFWWGVFFGPLGWVLAALLPERGRQCPLCRGVVPRGAVVCKHCANPLPEE